MSNPNQTVPPHGAESGVAVIHAEARRRLRAAGYGAHRAVHCEFDVGVLRLHGRLPSNYLKQLALRLVADLEGVQQIVDAIEVQDPSLRGRG